MRQTRSDVPLSPVIAAAADRRARGQGCARKGEGGKTKPKNNYIAETGLSRGEVSQNGKSPGARAGNLNAVRFPHHTPEDIDLYRRLKAMRCRAKTLLGGARKITRARKEAITRLSAASAQTAAR